MALSLQAFIGWVGGFDTSVLSNNATARTHLPFRVSFPAARRNSVRGRPKSLRADIMKRYLVSLVVSHLRDLST
jgi:hypothetical protein